jgi:hypothetical protein
VTENATLTDGDLDDTIVVLRTDFSDDAGWRALAGAVEPADPDPYLFVDDPDHDGADATRSGNCSRIGTTCSSSTWPMR